MTVTIPKPLLSIEEMIAKDTELLKDRKGRKKREQPHWEVPPKQAWKQRIQASSWNDPLASLNLWMSQSLANDQLENKGIAAS